MPPRASSWKVHYGMTASPAHPALGAASPGSQAHTAVFICLTHPFPRAPFPPPPSTFHTSSLAVTPCYFIRFHPDLARTVQFAKTDFTAASRAPPSPPPGAARRAPASPVRSSPAPRTAHLSRSSAGCALGRRRLSSAGRPRLPCPPGPLRPLKRSVVRSRGRGCRQPRAAQAFPGFRGPVPQVLRLPPWPRQTPFPSPFRRLRHLPARSRRRGTWAASGAARGVRLTPPHRPGQCFLLGASREDEADEVTRRGPLRC